MPKAQKRPTHRRTKSQVIIPRRMSDDERREKDRRQRYKAGAIDCWLCINASDTYDSSTILEEEVLCSVQLEYVPTLGDDGGFIDPDTYTLYLTIATPRPSSETESLGALQVHPRVVLETYRGWKENIDAPDWTRRKPGRELVFRQSRKDLSLLLSRVASQKVDDKSLIKRLNAMSLK
ncbi:hypothetical protein BDW22DRAFT_1354524 [Trametopsis cervina]|nr:hypothetical protein BDW22DRAFT_1354524 [Trametopsis cervina]